MTELSAITMAKDTIHNPAEPRHFMKLSLVDRQITVRRGDQVLARTTSAKRLKEVGRDLYEPALYIPRSDILATMRSTETSTHCPLKGDASYLSLVDEAGDEIVANIAWHYDTPLEIAAEIKGLVSFYTQHVSIEESPL